MIETFINSSLLHENHQTNLYLKMFMYFGSFISERKRKHQQMMQIFLDTNNQQVYNITFMREKERKKCAKTIFKSNVVIFCSILHFRELITVH